MNSFNFKRRNLYSGPHLLGLLLVIAGVFVLISPLLFIDKNSVERVLSVGFGAIIFGFTIVFSYDGTLIDFTKKRFKNYSSICGYKYGDWTALPAISTVKVISTSYMSTNMPNGISPTLSGKVIDFKLLIFSDSIHPLISFVYSNRDKAVRHAHNLASNLNADLVFTISEKA